MVWGGISLEGRTELVFVGGCSLTSARYVEEILLEHVLPYAEFVGENFMLMHDNARPHTARVVSDFLQTADIETMAWPACSPDLNPIEHVWDALGRRVRARNLNTLQDLRRALTEEWEGLPQATITNLLNGMGARMEAVIQARGGNQRY